MIVLDIESSGLDMTKCGIWQIGAIDLENPENIFLEESRIDDHDSVEEGALKVIGKTEEKLRDSSKQSQKQLILSFFKWVEKIDEKIIVGQNIGWDLNFIQNKVFYYDLYNEFKKVLSVKGLDLYAIAQLIYFKKYKHFKVNDFGKGKFNLSDILKFCGIPDPRISLRDYREAKEMSTQIEKQGTPHNALEDCKLEGECYSRLMYGKTIFPEYEQYSIPDYLIKN